MLRNKAPDWREQTIAERIQHCISMLYINGYIPESIRNKAHEKLKKQYNKENQ